MFASARAVDAGGFERLGRNGLQSGGKEEEQKRRPLPAHRPGSRRSIAEDSPLVQVRFAVLKPELAEHAVEDAELRDCRSSRQITAATTGGSSIGASSPMRMKARPCASESTSNGEREAEQELDRERGGRIKRGLRTATPNNRSSKQARVMGEREGAGDRSG